MFATLESDRRDCHQCHKPFGEIETDVIFLEDPAADPDVLSLYLLFCSVECAQKWVDENVVSREATDATD